MGIHANGTMWSTVPCNTTMMANLTLPAARYSHTQTGRIACGGINATANYTDCLVLAESGDGWLNHASLSKSFYQHTSWQSSSLGLVLMGGNIPGNNTEVAAARNQPFYLQGNYTLSCAISLSGNAVVLTGGNSTLTNVTEFNSDGLDTSNTHPSLNVGRMNHACGRSSLEVKRSGLSLEESPTTPVFSTLLKSMFKEKLLGNCCQTQQVSPSHSKVSEELSSTT